MNKAIFILLTAAFVSFAGIQSLWADDVCGDSNITGIETCDDGNTDDCDGCSSFCQLECGDGFVTCSEVCDDFGTFDGDGCSADCSTLEPGWTCFEFDPGPPPFFTFCISNCGDGLVVGFESCDEGNYTNGDGCDDDPFNGGNCTPTGCGNGVITAGEACDDFNPFDGDGCSADCSTVEPGWTCDESFGFSFCTTICGDGLLLGGEQCEDGNGVNGDGCDDDVNDPLTPGNCTFTACGNSVQSPDEECDDGKQCSDGTQCNTDDDCLFIDGSPCTTHDADDMFDFCDSNCTAPACGNGIINHIDDDFMTLLEDCDDGNTVNGDGCDGNCTVTACGNGILTEGEICDDGNTENDDGCSADCKPECGDGVQGANEECDDGGVKSGDGCSSVCTLEGPANVCGNGIRDAGEECDDGNTESGDGCDADCTDSSFESANPVLTFGSLTVGDSVVVNAPDPRSASASLAVKAAVLPSNCSCSWAVSPLALGHFSSAADCQTQLTLDHEGDGNLSVAADCGADGSGTFLQNIVVQPRPVEDSGGCGLIPSN
ncbi:MAG TPA: DUF4215 domain-containing protein [bacterium]|nr:DUF4215 domain-containing protein [bacterium]